MSFVSHAHATLRTHTEALSALPDAPVIDAPARTPWLQLRLPSLVRLTVAWNRRAEREERTWEYRSGDARPACA